MSGERPERDFGTAGLFALVMPKRLLLLTLAAFLLLAAPAPAALQKGFWGPIERDGVSQFPIYEDLGVDIFQLAVNWNAVATARPANPTDPSDPAYRWPADVDRAITEAAAHGMRVSLLVMSTPGWANGGRDRSYAPDDPQDYANFMTAAARRYPAVGRWMVWGEPVRAANWKPQNPARLGARRLTPAQARAPRRYAALLDAAYAALKGVRRSNKVIGGNSFTGGDVNPYNWVRYMRLPNGRPPRMDLYGHNPFGYRRPDFSDPPFIKRQVDFSTLPELHEQVQRYLGRRIKLFLSEWTVPTDRPDAEFNFHTTRAAQASWIRSAFRISRRTRWIDTLGWIHLYDEPSATPGAPGIQGGLIASDGVRKPGYAAFKSG
ncbi:MAG TPA: hypothetical protein VK279_04420 [Solirubrobacteraceae bacterium]|nr:hypothetical protein [Solirubrobacteraceae bacterium]